jgi:formate hydrogenlyase subunit 4
MTRAVMTIQAVTVQIALLLFLSPLITGFGRTLKARLQTRRGAGVLQPYRDLFKLLRKGMVLPSTASWIFSATPYVLFVTTLLAGLLIPALSAQAPLSLFGGVLAVVYLLALGRFFLALGGLDTGSSFGGLGSSREMTISAIAEPALMLAVFTVALGAGSTNLSTVAHAALGQSWRFLAPSQMLAFAALFIVLIAETGRIPVDNPATHLELTMVHEAMILEYSGPYLALIEWSASIKQLVLMMLLVNVFFPFGLSADWSPAAILLSLLWFSAKLLLLAAAVVLVETTNAKLRLFRVPELLAVAFVLSAMALIATFLF